MERTARLFKNGRNQAVRLPVEFEFDTDCVYIRKEKNGDITLSSRPNRQKSWQKVFELLPLVDMEDFLTSDERNQQITTRDPFEGIF